MQWNNFVRAWNDARIGDFFVNTLIVVIPALIFTLIISAMAAYVLARFEFIGNRFLFYLFLMGMLFPIFLALVPLFSLVNALGLLNTYFGLILVYIAYSLPFTIFFLIGFFKTLPSELPEAAIIDGANQYQVFFLVMLPLAAPGLLSMAIFNFLGMWNQYVLPLVLVSDENKYVLSQGLAFLLFKQFYQNDWSALFAAVTMIMIPTLVLYIVFQGQIQRGMTSGALKG
jgi:N-acetylglucosamine transport system permease protein